MQTIKANHWREVPENYTGIVCYNSGPKIWYLEGKKHRTDGPAIIWTNGFVEYWHYNKRTTKEAIELMNHIMKLKGL
jgi:hypothetical protein